MRNFWIGIIVAVALMLGGWMLWQAKAGRDLPIPDAPPPPTEVEGLPMAGPAAPAKGPPPPAPPEARKETKEEARFNRYDRDRDNIITRLEMMSSRTKDFKKLDRDGNNLLTFEEWAVATSSKFAGADGNGDDRLTRGEFATTRPATKPAAKPKCSC